MSVEPTGGVDPYGALLEALPRSCPRCAVDLGPDPEGMVRVTRAGVDVLVAACRRCGRVVEVGGPGGAGR